MTLEQFNSLNEDETAMLWHIVNKLTKPVVDGLELEPQLFTSINNHALHQRIVNAESSITESAKPIYSELMAKLNIK